MAKTALVDFPGYYIDRAGQVSSQRGVLKYRPTKEGYNRPVLTDKEGKRKSVYAHRLVAYTFLGSPLPAQVVNHKDGVKSNNCVENLEWVSVRDNIRHALATGLKKPIAGDKCSWSKLSEQDVLEIQSLKGGQISTIDLGERFKVSSRHISSIWRGVRRNKKGVTV